MDQAELKERFLEVSKSLESRHSIFSMFWDIGVPTISNEVERCGVIFNKDGEYMRFLFNPDFLESLDMEDLSFCVAHECMHLILGHGNRLKGLDKKYGNAAADIVINDMLLKSFGYNPSKELRSMMLTRESVFANNLNAVQKNREMEYYYNKLQEIYGENEEGDGNSKQGESGLEPLDSHDFLPENTPDEVKDMLDKMSDQEVDTLKKNIKAGDGDAFQWIEARLNVAPQANWQTVIKNWTIKQYREKHKVQWKNLDRRFVSIQRSMPDVHIPSVGPIDDKPLGRIDMTFFMDVSGSCAASSQLFFGAAKTIPKDKFLINAFAFNTGLIPVDITADKLPVGGGTSFHQLEEHCLKQRVYPSCVFVLTDGYGTDVKPKYPERWHIFLTEECRANFPKECNFYKFDSFYDGQKNRW